MTTGARGCCCMKFVLCQDFLQEVLLQSPPWFLQVIEKKPKAYLVGSMNAELYLYYECPARK